VEKALLNSKISAAERLFEKRKQYLESLARNLFINALSEMQVC
jgi:hypothetical protein